MKKRRLLAGLLALILCVGMLPAARATVTGGTVTVSTEEYATTGLTNVANRATRDSTVTEEASNPLDHLVDGNPSSMWVVNNGTSNGDFELDFASGAKSVSKIVLKFDPSSDGSTRGMTVKLTVNGAVVDTGTPVDSFSKKYIYEFNSATDVTSLRFDFSDRTDTAHDPGFWIGAAEVEVWASAADNPEPADPNAPKGCVNVTRECEISVDGGPETAGNMVDGNGGTLWNKGGNSWPATVLFKLPGNMLVQRVEIDFEKESGRSVDITLGQVLNNVTSDPAQITTKTGHALTDTYVYDAGEQRPRMTHLRIDLDNPNPNTLWPAIAEVRIYAVDEKIDLSKFANIADSCIPTVTQEGSVYTVDFGSNQQVAGYKMTLPAGTTGYKIEGKLKKDTAWKTYVNDGTGADTEKVLNYLTGMSAVRLTLTGANAADVTKFEVWGTYVEPYTDSGNLAFEKETHSNFSNESSYLVTDGGKGTGWVASEYPAYVDIDLKENYDINEIQVYTPATGYTQYSVYTSLNGRDFSLFADKQDKKPCNADTGDVHTVSTPVPARVVRVYLEYQSGRRASATLNEVRVLGTKSTEPYVPTPAVNISEFSTTQYAAEITEADTIAEVQGIVERQVGAAYVNWFTFQIGAADQNGYDYFELSDEGGKVKIVGNNGVSLATGLNHYLKYFCDVHISQVGNQVHMPAAVVPVGGTVRKETRFPVRYAYNYCTHSYSMSFWNEPEWRNELDWLALNGVNVVLDITGQEAAWYKFLTELDIDIPYTPQDAKDFLAGPGYYAWAYMANLTGLGGPIHDNFLVSRMELARKNQRIMRTLGMEPVLQAFSGMVPTDLTTHDPTAAVIPQGTWSGCQRPYMLKTDTETYTKYAEAFYNAQKYVLGDAKYYATDPFHEGGNTGGMDPTVIASHILDSLLDFDSDAVWVIQSWQGNPTSGLLAGLRGGDNPTREDRRDHAIVLDLYAERYENWKDDQSQYDYGDDTDGDGLVEFSDTPWVWCMLNNFGGRMGLHGYLDSMQKNIPAAANSAQHMKGVGISPEGSQENPVLYDFLYETIWTDDASQPLEEIDLERWLKDYARRRYGADSESAYAALGILKDTVYNGDLKNRNASVKQGAPESVVNARPALSIGSASSWGYSYICYDKTQLENAARLLLEDYDTLSASDPYLYDLADVLKQVLSNTAQQVHGDMATAYNAGKAEEFAAQSEKFLGLIDKVEEVLSTRKEFLFGKWTDGAVQMAKGTDDFTKRIYLRNAKALVTTWGSYNQCDDDRGQGLKDYSNRQWAGLTKDFYKARWQQWIDAAQEHLTNDTEMPSFDRHYWFPWEWEYVRDSKEYSKEPDTTLSLKTLGEEILSQYTVPVEAGSSSDNDLTAVSATAGSEQDSSNAAGKVLDDDPATIWHTNWNSLPATDKLYITLDLGSEQQVGGLRYLPRSDGYNGAITSYEIYVSTDGTNWGSAVTTGSWEVSHSWKTAHFNTVSARFVKLVAKTSEADDGNANRYASAAEIRVTGPAPRPETHLMGKMSIANFPRYERTLFAQVDPVQTGALTLSYQWKRGGQPIEGATSGSYTLQPEDVGQTISCTATADGLQGSLTATIGPIVKAYADAPTGLTVTDPTAFDAEDGKISGLKDNVAYQLSINGGSWSDATVTGGEITGLPFGEYQVRLKETGTHLASLPTTVILQGILGGRLTIAGDAAVGATLAAVAEDLPQDASPVYQWYRGETAIGDATEREYTVLLEDMDQTLYCVLTDGSGRYKGAISSAPTAPVTKGTPAAPELTWRNPSTVGGSNGSISGFEDGVDYEYTVNGGPWTEPQLVGGALTGLSAGVYQVRIKATDLYNPSEILEITLVDPGKAAVTKPTGLAASNVTTNSAVLTWKESISNAGDIAEYQIYLNDSDVMTKRVTSGVTTMLTGLSANTSYTVRMVAVDDKGNSSPEASLSFTTASVSGGTGKPSGGTPIPGGGGGPISRPTTEGSSTQTQTGADGTVTTTVTDYATGTVTTTSQQPSGRKSVKVSTPGEGVSITLTAPGDGEVLAKITLPETEAPAESVFDDVPENHWAKDAVNELATLGLVKGTSETTFSGTLEMNRGMMATILHRLSGELTSAKSAFTDVKDTAYYAKAVDWASAVGILKGINAETYAPERPVSRQELAMMLYRYAGFLGLDTKVSQSDLLDTFTDKAEVASWTGDAMTWAVEKGLLKGRGNEQLAPVATATRAEVVVILDRFLDMIR